MTFVVLINEALLLCWVMCPIYYPFDASLQAALRIWSGGWLICLCCIRERNEENTNTSKYTNTPIQFLCTGCI